MRFHLRSVHNIFILTVYTKGVRNWNITGVNTDRVCEATTITHHCFVQYNLQRNASNVLIHCTVSTCNACVSLTHPNQFQLKLVYKYHRNNCTCCFYGEVIQFHIFHHASLYCKYIVSGHTEAKMFMQHRGSTSECY